MSTPSQPNLFAFATSELSQDAALAWLLAWADPAHATADAPLHERGTSLLRTLLDRTGHGGRGTICRVEVQTQYERVDVFVKVHHEGEEAPVALLIEDKVGAGPHGDQLATYAAWGRDNYPDRAGLVYLKTHDGPRLIGEKHEDWFTFDRPALLDVLEADPLPENDVYQAFLAHLRHIDARHDCKALPVAEWTGADPWRGFFTALQRELQEHGELQNGSWGYVPNRKGGFMGYWWNGVEVDDGHVYLQIQGSHTGRPKGKLVFKLASRGRNAEERRSARTYWHEQLVTAGDQNGSLDVIKPNRFGHGKTMTVAELAGDIRQWDGRGRLDLSQTKQRLIEAHALLRRAARSSTR